MTALLELEKIFLTDEEVSVKVIFDNVRNYALGAGVIALHQWLGSGAPKTPISLAFLGDRDVLAGMALLFGIFLLLINGIQSILIVVRFMVYRGPWFEDTRTAWQTRNGRRLGRVWVIASFLTEMGVIMIVLCLALATVTMGFLAVVYGIGRGTAAL